MTKIKLTIVALFASLLMACSLQTSIEVASGLILASDSVDTMQVELGEYSNNQDTLTQLDTLQANVKATLTKGADLDSVLSYYTEALEIYSTLKAEVQSRSDELTDEQITTLTELDTQLIAINTKIIALKDEAEDTLGLTDMVDSVYQAVMLLEYFGAI